MSYANSSAHLRQTARTVIIEQGFAPDASPETAREADAMRTIDFNNLDSDIVDLRGLLWSSIDNDDSRDLDQIEFAERLNDDRIGLRVGIADVDAFVPQNSAIDRRAAANTTSVYTGVRTFPMLPSELSEDATSLLENRDRLAVVVDFTVAADGTVRLNDIYRAATRNHAKLDYESVGAWLDGNAAVPPEVAETAGLEQQIRLQNTAAMRLQNLRRRAGALEFGTIEATTKRRGDDGYEIVVQQKSAARYLIENLMITTNVLTAGFLESQNFPALERIVKTPDRWLRIVDLAASFGEKLPDEADAVALSAFLERRRIADSAHFPDLSLSVVKLIGSGDYTVVAPGADGGSHFGLAVNDYAHSTAPNRRYADLVTQRLLKAAVAGKPAPYTIPELETIADRCNERQSAARKVERKMRKIVAAGVLSDRIGDTFKAIVTGASAKGVFARLLNPPAEGRIVRGEDGLDVGDKITVRLIDTEPAKGFIDFARI